MRKAKAYMRVLLFALWSIPLVLSQMLVLMVHRGRWAYKVPRAWHWGLCKIFGMKVRIVGTPSSTTTPVMFISNHVSYLDIMVMGSKIEASFVAKNDVATWPVFGFLSNLQQTAYISRARRDAVQGRNSLQAYLKAGKSIILFPEGTTNNGAEILPFKSSLFALAHDHHLTGGLLMVQPFSLRIIPKTHPQGIDDARAYTWAFDDDTPLVTHLMRFLSGRGCILELVFHQVVDPKQYKNRKPLCRVVEAMVKSGHRDGTIQAIPPVPGLTGIFNQPFFIERKTAA